MVSVFLAASKAVWKQDLTHHYNDIDIALTTKGNTNVCEVKENLCT